MQRLCPGSRCGTGSRSESGPHHSVSLGEQGLVLLVLGCPPLNPRHGADPHPPAPSVCVPRGRTQLPPKHLGFIIDTTVETELFCKETPSVSAADGCCVSRNGPRGRHPGPGLSFRAQSLGVHCCKADAGPSSHTCSLSPDRRWRLSLWLPFLGAGVVRGNVPPSNSRLSRKSDTCESSATLTCPRQELQRKMVETGNAEALALKLICETGSLSEAG